MNQVKNGGQARSARTAPPPVQTVDRVIDGSPLAGHPPGLPALSAVGDPLGASRFSARRYSLRARRNSLVFALGVCTDSRACAHPRASCLRIDSLNSYRQGFTSTDSLNLCTTDPLCLYEYSSTRGRAWARARRARAREAGPGRPGCLDLARSYRRQGCAAAPPASCNRSPNAFTLGGP